MDTKVQRFTLIQQNDTHAYMEAHWEHFWRNGKPEYRRAGGYARAATIVRQIKAETDGHCLLADCGDTIHGTGPAMWTQGAAIVPALNALGVELMTPGNWEFGFGPEVLRARLAEMQFPVIACNVEQAASGDHEFPPSVVRDIGGVRIGFIGITSPIVTQTMPKKFGAGLRFTAPADTLPRCISQLRRDEQAELIVVISHLGFPQEVKLATEVPGIDVLLSGHTHNRLAEPVRVGQTLLLQSGFDGAFLGRLDIEVTNGRISTFRHQLIEVAESIVADSKTERVINEQLAPFRQRLNEVIGQTATALHRMTVLEATMDNLITDAYLELTGADVAFSHGWRYGAPIPPGAVTVGDLWQIIPTNPEIFVVEMSGAEIRHKLEKSLESVYAPDAFNQKGGYLLRVSGLNAIVRLNNPKGTRIEQLDIAGAPFEAERRYQVAAAGEQDVKSGTSQQRTGTHAIEALREYFRRHSPVHADLSHTKFVAV
ncbi:MAG: 5'-nucleotidase C-terminal domain-containing protein [Acidobacteria bacterium]|nr:5'-nucleotidase C-terminal domain-containing protein [Acidobacteriota bacterium]